MTGTDEHRNSRSRSGTPSRGDNVIPQPVFQSRPGSPSRSGMPPSPGPAPELPAPAGFVYAPQMQGVQQPPAVGGDPFRVYVPAQHQGIINLNDEVPPMQNALQQGINMPGPLSQEGRHFWWHFERFSFSRTF